jgi:hypothetical protein
MPIEKLQPLVPFAAMAGCAMFDQIETSAEDATLPAFRTLRVLVALRAMSRPTLSTQPESGGGSPHHTDTSVLDPARN